MLKKVVIIISTAEKEKALVGFMYGTNAMRNKGLADVKLILFGPIQKLIIEDQELQEAMKKFQEFQESQAPIACKLISDNEGVSDKLEAMGFQVEYVGSIISAYINDDYIPMVF